MGKARVAGAEAALDALGDPTRRSILRLLTEQPRSVQEVADRLPVSRPAVSQHLRVLRGAGLVTSTQQGARRIYRLDADGATAVREYLDDMWSVALKRFAMLADNTTPQARPDPAPGQEDGS
jgi:DNA-binding transcriptional ArsR family regulator